MKPHIFLEKIKSKKVFCDKCNKPFFYSKLKKVDYETRYCVNCYYNIQTKKAVIKK